MMMRAKDVVIISAAGRNDSAVMNNSIWMDRV
jgi:hypothetical protein